MLAIVSSINRPSPPSLRPVELPEVSWQEPDRDTDITNEKKNEPTYKHSSETSSTLPNFSTSSSPTTPPNKSESIASSKEDLLANSDLALQLRNLLDSDRESLDEETEKQQQPQSAIHPFLLDVLPTPETYNTTLGSAALRLCTNLQIALYGLPHLATLPPLSTNPLPSSLLQTDDSPSEISDSRLIQILIDSLDTDVVTPSRNIYSVITPPPFRYIHDRRLAPYPSAWDPVIYRISRKRKRQE